ncbi:AAA family ATPase [Cupriavidus necator]|uniref:AAA family ATPase n=1 Tax=Cupriavidus necator TaxID=106590 RepID=UPI00339D8CC6
MPAIVIRRIAPLRNVGVFKDCKLAEAEECLQYNLVYGFNGSGKTTLSRIFGSLETGVLRPELPSGGYFEIQLSDGSVIKSDGNIDGLKSRLLVFNVDFVEESFKWKEGTAKPVFYLGREQAALAEELAEVSRKIHEFAEPLKSSEALQSEKDKGFVQLKRDAARLIAEQLNLGRKYDAQTLALDYVRGSYSVDSLRDEDQRSNLRAILMQESALAAVAAIESPGKPLRGLVETVRLMAPKTIGSMTLEGLSEHESMRDWLAIGLKYHSAKALHSCLFCGGDLTASRLDDLRRAIDNAYDEFKVEIKSALALPSQLKILYGRLVTNLPSPNDMSQSVRANYVSAVGELRAAVQELEQICDSALTILTEKDSSPNSIIALDAFVALEESIRIDEVIGAQVKAINVEIRRHNEESADFAETKNRAAKELKSHYLAEGEQVYLDAKKSAEDAKKGVDEIRDQISKLKDRERELKKAVRKHGPAASVINKLIHSYLGRQDLSLVPKEDGYQLERNGSTALGSLSEGEKTAISLCYFLSTIEAEGRKRKDLIVVLDDPVSSLDTKAMNYAFGIVKAALGDAGQLFLLTHNLNFMNETKKWLRMRTKKEAERNGKEGTAALLFLDTVQDGDATTRRSSLIELPKYIRDYESEYHYLFHLVLRFNSAPDEHHGYFYIIPNALRKLLDVFLAFKLPGPDGLTSKVEAILKLEHGLDAGRVRALERLAQVESHADNLDDLVGFSSMTVEETKEAAKSLFALISAVDGEHYRRMERICRLT